MFFFQGFQPQNVLNMSLFSMPHFPYFPYFPYKSCSECPQFVPPTFCLCFAFTGIDFQGMSHHVCDMHMTKTCVEQLELVNVGAQNN